MKIIPAIFFTFIIGTLILIATNCVSTNPVEAVVDSPKSEDSTIDSKPKTNDKRTPVVVELFTSEGCSSCPPADGNLSMLVATQPVAGAEIIALSEHVDYWNRLGWTDPFSAAQFSGRQSEYAQFFKRDDVYTPQIIVGGTREFVGGDMREALKQIAAAAAEISGDVNLEIEKDAGDALSVKVKTANLPKIPNDETAIVLLAVTEDNLTSNVARGENGGRRLTHTAVTRSLQTIGSASNDAQTLSANVALGKDWKRENLNLVAFVQETKSRRILGAAKIELKK